MVIFSDVDVKGGGIRVGFGVPAGGKDGVRGEVLPAGRCGHAACDMDELQRITLAYGAIKEVCL